jgi:hypothetical protein
MKRVGATNRMVLGAMLAALSALLFAPTAGAQFAAQSSADEAPAGITVTGIGLAPTKADAADRAVGDARQRAAGIAAGLALDLGGVEGIHMPELVQFARSSRRCPPSGCRKAVVARMTFSIIGGASAADVDRAVSASGFASVPVEPGDPASDRSIRRAILTARHASAQEAVDSALRNAKTAAGAAGLQLGPVVSVVESGPAYPFPDLPFYPASFEDPLLGSWGPGVFCGTARRFVIQRDPETGKPTFRRVLRRRCFVPRTYDTHLEIAYSASRSPGV